MEEGKRERGDLHFCIFARGIRKSSANEGNGHLKNLPEKKVSAKKGRNVPRQFAMSAKETS